MKKVLYLFFVSVLHIAYSSCNSNGDDNPSNNPSTTELEGIWRLQNNQAGARLIFANNNFTIISGTVTIEGTFALANNQMNGQVVSRSGFHNQGLQPDTFTGNFSISDNKVTFTNFSGNWYAVFSTWYQRE